LHIRPGDGSSGRGGQGGRSSTECLAPEGFCP
jgi:hypothetical protein